MVENVCDSLETFGFDGVASSGMYEGNKCLRGSKVMGAEACVSVCTSHRAIYVLWV